MRVFCCSLIVAGLILAGCSGSKDAVEAEPEADEEQVAEDTEPVVEAEPAAVVASPVAGDWEGPLTHPDGSTLPVVFHITEDDAETLTATLDSPDQGAFGVPVDEVRFEDGVLYLYVKVIEGSYTGTLQEGAATIEGTWTQPAGSLALIMARVEE